MMRRLWLRVFTAVLVAVAAQALGAPRIANPSFEADGAATTGVGYIVYGNRLTGWTPSNPMNVARNTATGPFFDNGAVPDGRCVCVLQNQASIAQRVTGLRPGSVYEVSLRVNARRSDGPSFGAIEVTIGDTIVVPSRAIEPVGTDRPYHRIAARVRAGAPSHMLRIAQTNATAGVSILVDDVRFTKATVSTGSDIIELNPAEALHAALARPDEDMTDLEWIWSSEAPSPATSAPPGRRRFARRFELPAGIARATLAFTADNRCRATVNDRVAGWSSTFQQIYRSDVTTLVRAGANRLVFEVANDGDRPSPAGLIAKLTVVVRNRRSPIVFATDRSWSWTRPGAPSSPSDSKAQRVTVAGTMGDPPWGWVGPRSRRVSRMLPDFRTSGDSATLQRIRALLAMHLDGAQPVATMWDAWLPMSSLWAAAGRPQRWTDLAARWKRTLLEREISEQGYVATHQHRGYGHSKGWPIPLYMQTGGVGLHFSVAGDPFMAWVPRLAEPSEWSTEGCEPAGLDRSTGWRLEVQADQAAITSPEIDVPMAAAPFVRVEWQVLRGSVGAAEIWWTEGDATAFDASRAVRFTPATVADGMCYSDVEICTSPAWNEGAQLRRLRLVLRGATGSRVIVKSIITPADTRHPTNNAYYLQGCSDYAAWTGDVDFVRRNVTRMRRALDWAIREFDLERSLCVSTAWFGHDGRSGFVRDDSGKRVSRYALGMGANYWDLLPFGGKDALATIYYYDVLRRMADIEAEILAHPEWRITARGRTEPHRLRQLATRIRWHAGRLFWNASTKRFVACIDRDGIAHDYGYTTVNQEAIHYGFATREQAADIMAWLDGRRIVAGDTSKGADIYRWRFAPRASTLRNTDWYSGMWDPDAVLFGDQVQDGGAVLGWSYFDLMSRLSTLGPDDSWSRLSQIARWFAEVQSEGGYRAYYAKPGRGTLQGGGPPGGLGMDVEFVESVLVPQVVLYGFAGFRPGMGSFSIRPRLPRACPDLTITRIVYHGVRMDIHIERGRTVLSIVGGKPTTPLRLSAGGLRNAPVLVSGRATRRASLVGGAYALPATPGLRIILRHRP